MFRPKSSYLSQPSSTMHPNTLYEPITPDEVATITRRSVTTELNDMFKNLDRSERSLVANGFRMEETPCNKEVRRAWLFKKPSVCKKINFDLPQSDDDSEDSEVVEAAMILMELARNWKQRQTEQLQQTMLTK